MMTNNPLDDIVKCNIDISSPASDDASLDAILLVVRRPSASAAKTLERAVAISRADELLDYGYDADDAAYVAAAVAFSQNPAPDKLYVCARGETTAEGAATVAYEDVAATLARAKGEAPFYGFHLTDFKDEADVRAAVSWAEANEKLFGFEYSDVSKCPVKNFSFYRSFGIFSGNADGYGAGAQPPENGYAALAWMAKCFGYEPGTETWNMKPLAGIVPSALGADEKKSLEEIHVNSFRRYAGSNVTFGGNVLSGEWIDVVRFRDWLKAEMQANVFGALKGNRKVPFTDAGIGMVEGQMAAALAKGQSIGGIAPTEHDADGNEVPGYTVKVPKASSLTEAERKSRKLAGCRYTARLAGAIHLVEIHGNLTF